ncbi:MAG: methyltransferase family protein [Anaerolineales bacterium]
MAKEQDHPDISPMVHPPLVALMFIVIAYFLGRFVPLPIAAPTILRYIGLAMTFVGFLLGLGALVEFRKARTTLDSHGSARQLVISGVYRFTRNPIYLGFLLMVVGLPLNSGLYWGILMAPLYILLMNRLIVEHEETYLEKKFGKTYTSYKSRVRRWL